MNNYYLNQKTPKEIDKVIALRILSIRKVMNLTQEKLSEKSGVSLGSVKRFEHTGEISLSSLTKIAIAMECENDLESLFSERPFKSIQEVINGQD